MKILVTGATGFVGKALLPILKERGHDITVLTRDPETAPVRLPVACRVLRWDPALLEPPPEALRDVQAVVHLAGENIAGRWSKARKAELERSRLLSTHQLVKCLKDMGSWPEVFISCSGVGYYGDRKSEELDEDAGRGEGFLAALCEKWEAEALAARSLGIRTVALRIGVVLGNDGGAFRFLLPAFRMGLGGRCGNGRQWMSWIHIRDMARLIVHALDTPSLEGPVNAVSPNPATNREFSETLARVVRRPALLPLPGFAARLLFADLAEVLLFSQRVLSRKLTASGFTFLYPELEPALQSLGDTCTHELVMEQWVPQPPDKVFAFFSNAKNLEVVTPPWLNFEVLGQSTPEMEEGTRINYRLSLHGIPFRWQSMILDWNPHHGFTDIQTIGPYRLWHHSHEFVEQGGGTLIRDCAVYRVPLWTPGDVVLHPFVRKDLEEIFSYRRRKIEEVFGATDPA